MRKYNYVDLRDKNDLGVVGIAYSIQHIYTDRDEKVVSVLDLQDYGDYWGFGQVAWDMPKSYNEDQIISETLRRLNDVKYAGQGTGIAGTKEQILADFKEFSGLDIKL